MKELLKRLKGAGVPRPPRPSFRAIWLGGAGSIIGIAVLGYLGAGVDHSLLLGSFGASCVLLFGFPEAPFSQPINVVAGHLICTTIGLVALHVLGPHPWALAVAVGLSIIAMMATRTVHPPAGSNPVIVFLAHAPWSFLVFPVLSGALILVLIALFYNNLAGKKPYPTYW